ncbi:MAG TPA: efflux RND transporter periplasmic adaptor subunit [Polyangiaceae bacterium]|nr:efflux RND transporter periplasmic adaptor subunit [Polyangiaceae bacterium]
MERLPALTFVVAMALLGAGCRRAPSPERAVGVPTGTVVLSTESQRYIHVETAAAPPASVQHTLFARVAFDERRVAALGSPVGGRVSRVHVVTGDKVRVGQPLLTISSTEVGAARAQVTEAREARMLAEQVAARAALLVQQGAGSVAEQERAETALAQARAEERRAGQSLGALGVSEAGGDYVLKSPIEGVVVERTVQAGNAVSSDAGAALITVADLSAVWVLADVFEQDVPSIATGNAAVVRVAALGGREFEGTVGYVGDIVDATTRAARARVELKNPDGVLRPGMYAEVEVKGPQRAVAYVPVSAVLARRDEFYVFVPQGTSSYAPRKVKVGRQVGDHIAVVTGLEAGERIVTRGAILLDAEANAAL